MLLKRGRPLSGESNDPKVERRRMLERLRQQRRRERERSRSADDAGISTAQRAQGDQVVTLPSVAEEDAAITLLSLGMRKSPDLHIGEDIASAEQQGHAEGIDEHVSLYTADVGLEEEHPRIRRRSTTGFFY